MMPIQKFIKECQSLPKSVGSPINECTVVEGTYRHCWNNCKALRCTGLNILAINAILAEGLLTELFHWAPDSQNDLLANLNGIINSFKADTCEASCKKTTQDAVDKNCCNKKQPMLKKLR